MNNSQSGGNLGGNRPDFESILEEVRKLGPKLAERAHQTELDKRVSDQTMGELRDTGLFKVMQPASFGGYEYGPTAMASVGFELGRHCGSTAWCGTLAMCFGWMTSFFPLEAQQEVWDDPENLLAVAYLPTRNVEIVDGGYKIAGTWPWASGVDASKWLILAGVIPTEAGPPKLAWFLVPTKDVDIDHDSWDVSGLRGTGSKTVSITDPVFIPEHRALPLSATMSGQVPGLEVENNIQAKFGYPTFGPTALCAPILGMAQGAIDAFTETASQATRMARPGVFEKVAESTLIQRLIGQNSARMDAARTLMFTSIQQGEDIIRNGGKLTIEQRLRIRSSHGFGSKTSAEVTNEIFNKSGAAAAGAKNSVQRLWRDANAAATHASIDNDMIGEMSGTRLLGLEPLGIF